MYLPILTAVWFFVVFTGTTTHNNELGHLIERIHQDSKLSTVYFVVIGDFHFNEFFKINSTITTAIFTRIPDKLSEVKTFKRNVIFVLSVPCETWDDSAPYLTMIEEFIKRLPVRKYIILVGSNHMYLEGWFSYFKKKKFTKIFGIVEQDSFVYLPYADIKIQKLPNTGSLPDDLKDLNGFSFRTIVQTEIPRVFRYKSRDGRDMVGGSEALLFLAFIHKHNATFKEILINNSSKLSIPEMLAATRNDEIDISMNPYSTLEEFELSYPIKFLNWIVLVPIRGFLDPNQYFLKPFTAPVWTFVGVIFVYIVVIDLVKDHYTRTPIKLWLYISRSFLTLLSMPAQRRSSAYRFHIQVIFLAFVLGNLYSVHLTSFLTALIKVEHFKTLQDLIENNIRIMMPYYEWPFISDPELHVPVLENIVELVDGFVYVSERDSLKNTSFAYAVGIDKAEFLMNLQMNFDTPRFYILYENLMEYYLGFILVKHSPFIEILNMCIMQSMETGLLKKWASDAIVQVYGTDFVKYETVPQSAELLKPFTLKHLYFAWNTLIMGLSIATIVFLGERCFKVCFR